MTRILSLLLTFALFAGCGERSRAPVLPAQPGGDAPDQESWDATITFTDSGRVTGILRAGYIGKFSRDRFTILDSGIVLDFFNERYEHTSVLTALRGRVDDITNDFEARGNVVVRSDSGTILKTEELYWNNKRERVHTEAFVEIVSPTEEIRGIGLESDQSLTHYTILRVTGKAQPK
ncbi:MAG TPA: LPS export ABC transporter periplasmic protein LptC [Bacteroidota bacterium]|nr:LPS export ABC transporter periplasmic protein LptC [Bacteroidota bacterium]